MKEELCELFGSESRLGITETFDGEAIFPDGSPMANCTNCARRVIALIGRGEIWGYSAARNPNTMAGDGCDGHDFAIIDERWLVDVWARYFAGITEQVVFDIIEPADTPLIKHLYGDRNHWELVTDIR